MSIGPFFKKHREEERERECARKHLVESPADHTQSIPHLDPTDVTELVYSNRGAAGVFVSGDSGSGKSVTLENLFRALADAKFASDSDSSILMIDPTGDLATSARNYCLSRGGSVAARLQYVQLASPHFTVALHPLHVRRRPGMTDIEFRARLEARVAYATHILLAAWGQSSWENTPLLYQYVSLFLRSIALMNLPMAEVVHFLSPQSEIFQLLSEHVPDYFARMELNRLAAMRPKDAYDEIRSTLLRFRGFLSNPIVQAVLGVTEGFIDCRQMIHERQIVIIDASNPGTLRDEDVQILCNLWLCEWFDTVFTFQPHERAPNAIIVDELPLFAPSFPMLERNLRLIRKTRTRIIAGSQFSFPDGIDSPLLQAMTAHTGIKFLHRHVSPRDAGYWADFVTTQTYDEKKVKVEYHDQEPYHAGYELYESVSRSINTSYSDAEGGGASQHESSDEGNSFSLEQGANTTNTDSVNAANAKGSTHTENESTNRQSGVFQGLHKDEQFIARSFNDGSSELNGSQKGTADSANQSQTLGAGKSLADGRSQSAGRSRSFSFGFARDSSSNWARTRNVSIGETYAQSWLPRYEWRDVLKMLEYYTWEEQQKIVTRNIATFSDGACFLAVSGLGIVPIQMPLTRDPYAHSPTSLKKDLIAYVRRVVNLPQYQPTKEIIAMRQRRLKSAVAAMKTLLAQNKPQSLTRSSSDLIFPGDDLHDIPDRDFDAFLDDDPDFI